MKKIEELIDQIPFIDTHEHLIDEKERLNCLQAFIPCDDWTNLLGLYAKFDLVAAGMSSTDLKCFESPTENPVEKWKLIQNYWEAIQFTGYGQVLRFTLEELYGISNLKEEHISELEEKYNNYRRKGFYRESLKRANVKACIVNPPGRAFKETEMPDLLYQDLNAMGMIRIDEKGYNEGIVSEVKSLDDWLQVIDWWFEQYAAKAVGVKIGIAYFRRLNFAPVSREQAEPLFLRKFAGKTLTDEEEKMVEDYLFWYVIGLANRYDLPVKLHTGHQAMNNFMDMENIMFNPSDCAALCKNSPDTKFIFYHIAYPHYEAMISLAKHYSNAIIDMCYAWTINPIASVDFLKKYIMSAPLNKLMVFGGDDLYVENVIGHAKLARKGIAKALSDLVQENWITEDDAFEIAEQIMWKNGEKIYGIACA